MMVLLAALAAAGCPASPESVDAHAVAAGTAWVAGDARMFEVARTEMELELDCLQAPLPRQVAARVHRVMGYATLPSLPADPAAAPSEEGARHFAVATAHAPELGPAPGLPPDWRPPAPDTAPRLPPPLSGRLHVDGVPGARPFEATPALVQVATRDGTARHSFVYQDGDTLPYTRKRRFFGGTAAGLGVATLGLGALVAVDGLLMSPAMHTEGQTGWLWDAASTCGNEYPTSTRCGFFGEPITRGRVVAHDAGVVATWGLAGLTLASGTIWVGTWF